MSEARYLTYRSIAKLFLYCFFVGWPSLFTVLASRERSVGGFFVTESLIAHRSLMAACLCASVTEPSCLFSLTHHLNWVNKAGDRSALALSRTNCVSVNIGDFNPLMY